MANQKFINYACALSEFSENCQKVTVFDFLHISRRLDIKEDNTILSR